LYTKAVFRLNQWVSVSEVANREAENVLLVVLSSDRRRTDRNWTPVLRSAHTARLQSVCLSVCLSASVISSDCTRRSSCCQWPRIDRGQQL